MPHDNFEVEGRRASWLFLPRARASSPSSTFEGLGGDVVVTGDVDHACALGAMGHLS